MSDSEPATPRLDSTFNIEHFLRGLTLQPLLRTESTPSIPASKAYGTVVPLMLKPGGFRKLRRIKVIDGLGQASSVYFHDLNTHLGTDGTEFKALPLSSQTPTKDIQENIHFNPYEVHQRSDVIFTVERGPLRSVQTLLHTIDRDLSSLRFLTASKNATFKDQLLDPIFFAKLDARQEMGPVKCIVVPLAPWEFTSQEFDDFIFLNEFVDDGEAINGEHHSPQWGNAHKMWAYLHDLCCVHDCRYFVVTTYEIWCFGGFSDFLTTGFASQAHPWDVKPNSLLEIFTYWMLSACSTENSMMLHEDHETQIDGELFEEERQVQMKRMLGHNPIGIHTALNTQEKSTELVDRVAERVGWKSPGHQSKRFKRIKMDPPIPKRHGREDRPKFALIKPSLKWNDWQKRRARAETEKTSTPLETGIEGVGLLISQRHSGYPIPCYSMDIDRENGCFRQELVAFRSFPIPP